MARNGHADSLGNVRSRGQSGKHLLTLSFSGFDPSETLSRFLKT
jgi:hypothetical protein